MPVLTLALVACFETGAEPARDADGCWTDADEAWLATAEASCAWQAQCVEGADADECLDKFVEMLATGSIVECYDGCMVDECLAATEKAAETCDNADMLAACTDGAYHLPRADEECVKPW